MQTNATMQTETMAGEQWSTVAEDRAMSQWSCMQWSSRQQWSSVNNWSGMSHGGMGNGSNWDQGSVSVVVGDGSWGQDGRHGSGHGKKTNENLIMKNLIKKNIKQKCNFRCGPPLVHIRC